MVCPQFQDLSDDLLSGFVVLHLYASRSNQLEKTSYRPVQVSVVCYDAGMTDLRFTEMNTAIPHFLYSTMSYFIQDNNALGVTSTP